jgi:transcriptional regulator with XRE-family HTH domain
MRTMLFNLKILRSQFGYSQVKLSHESQVSLPTIQNIEAGKANPTIDVLVRLTKVFGLSIKIEPQPFDIEKAIALGVPLASMSKTSSPPMVNSKILKQEVKSWHHPLLANSLAEREEVAMVSFIIALKDHYASFYDEIKSPIFEQKIKEYGYCGKVIKLRRMALSNLSKYL